jgi:hypothetical protein
MSNFAKINNDNLVEEIIVIPDEKAENGQEFINEELGIDGTWIQVSDEPFVHKFYPATGYRYVPESGGFHSAKPFPSWILREEDYQWLAPQTYPESEGIWIWDEESWTSTGQGWVEYQD